MPRKKKVFNLDEVKRKTEEVLASQPAHQQIMDAAAVASGVPSQQIEVMPETTHCRLEEGRERLEASDSAGVSQIVPSVASAEIILSGEKQSRALRAENMPVVDIRSKTQMPSEDEPPKNKTDWTVVIGSLKTLEDVQSKLMELTTNTRCPTRILKRLQLAAKALMEMKKSSKGDEKNIPAAKVKNMLRALKKAYCEAWASLAGREAAIRIVDRIQEYCGKSLRVQYPEIDKACLALICECGNEIVTPKCEAECLSLEATLERL